MTTEVSLDLVDQKVLQIWGDKGFNVIKGTSLKSLFLSFVTTHQDSEGALNGFIQCYYYLISNDVTNKGIHILLTCITETLERCGNIFTEHPYEYENGFTTQDHILLLLTKIYTVSTEISTKETALDQLRSLLEGSQFSSISPSSLSLIVSSILKFSDSTPELISYSVHCLSSALSHPQWADWNAAEIQLENLYSRIQEKDVISFVSLLFEKITLLQPYILSIILLPLLDQVLMKPKQATCFLQSQFLSNFLIQLLPILNPPLSGSYFILWSDCVSMCVKSRTWDMDWEQLILFLTGRLREAKTYRIQMRCLALLIEILQMHKEDPIDVLSKAVICKECVHLLGETNEKLIARVLQLLPLVMTSDRAPVTSLVLLLFVKAVKKDVEMHSLSPSTVRQEAFNFLCHSSSLTLSSLFRFGILPLYPIREYIAQQSDVVELVKMVVKNDIDAVQVFYSSNPIHNVLVDLILSICFGEQENLLNKMNDLQSSTSDQRNLTVVEVQAQLEYANHTSLATQLSPSLQSLTLVPFSTLQETLIRLSNSFQDENRLVCLLRLLRVINHVCLQRNKRLAQQTIDDRPSIEKQLNVRAVYRSHIASLST